MRFRLVLRWMTLDDLGAMSSNFLGISRDFADLGGKNGKRMKIDLCCQRHNCSPLNVLFSDA